MAKLEPSDYDCIDAGVGIDNFLDDSVDLMTFFSCFCINTCVYVLYVLYECMSVCVYECMCVYLYS